MTIAASGWTEWEPRRLEALCTQVTDGKHGDCQDEPGSGFYFLSCKDVAAGKLNYQAARQITKADFLDTHRRTKLAPLDILITNSGTIGRMALVPESVLTARTTFQKSVAILKPILGRVEPRFLYFALQADLRRLIEFAGGTAQKNLLLRDLRAFEVRLPPLPIQRRIASILGAYDDLIEVNRRRIAVLEEMARRLFDEWFVHFRFLGHEGHKMVDTEHGRLPEGWIVTTIGEAFSMTGGGTPSREQPAYWERGSVPWFTPTDLTGAKTTFMDSSKTCITEEGLRRSSATLFPPGCVMMTSRATIGAIAINTTSASTNQGFITCFPNQRVPRSFLFYWLRQNVEVFIANANGATFKEITKGVFKRLPICLPQQDMLTRFEVAVGPMMDLMLSTERAQRKLTTSRDLLLPRLISGELSVTEAERELDAAA